MTDIRIPPLCLIYISIHTLHTEGDDDLHGPAAVPHGISIHTLHTEGDIQDSRLVCIRLISIHTLHTEGDKSA